MTQPNFLLFITDQQRADWLGCYGHPVLRTPHIDAIASNGIRFEQFHVASPVCMPNRASIMTGRYPSVHGLRYNGCVLPHTANTFVDVLRASGYSTTSIGKSHLQPFTDLEANIQARIREHYNGPIAEAWRFDRTGYDQEEPGRYTADGRYTFDTPYYGFDEIDMVTSHGDVAGGHYLQWLRERTSDWQALRDPGNPLPHDYTCPQAKRTRLPVDLYPTRYIGDRAVDWLQHRDDDRPFFLVVSFPDPHHPFNPPGEYWDRYVPDQFTPDPGFDDLIDPPLPPRHAQARLAAGQYPPTPQEAFAATTRQCQEAMALTAGMIAMIDDEIGRVLDALGAQGHADDTVVAFTSDHGDYLGDANLLLKGPWIRTSIHQVPFLWSDPSRRDAGVVTPVLGSSIDIGTTILARAGIAPYFGIQGRDLMADVGQGEGRTHLLIEHNDNSPRMGLTHAARSRTIVDGRWRLTLYGGEGWGELYDTESDPRHCRNLWDDAVHASVKSDMLEALAVEMTAAMDESPSAMRRA